MTKGRVAAAVGTVAIRCVWDNQINGCHSVRISSSERSRRDALLITSDVDFFRSFLLVIMVLPNFGTLCHDDNKPKRVIE